MLCAEWKEIGSLRIIGILVGLGLFFFGVGCARTVTDLTPVLEGEFEIVFRGSVDTRAYNYYLIFSSSGLPVVPAQPPPDEYFPSPGRLFDQFSTFVTGKSGGFNFYYQTYFSTWSDYVVATNEEVLLYKSNAAGFDASTTVTGNSQFQPEIGFQVTHSLAQTGSSTLLIRFQMQGLSNASPTLFSTLYFTVATSRRDLTGENQGTGLLLDVLDPDPSNPSQITVLGQEQVGPFPDPEENTLDGTPGADIVSWKVKIF